MESPSGFQDSAVEGNEEGEGEGEGRGMGKGKGEGRGMGRGRRGRGRGRGRGEGDRKKDSKAGYIRFHVWCEDVWRRGVGVMNTPHHPTGEREKKGEG